MERAVTWIFSHPECTTTTADVVVESVDSGAADYELFAFVSHKGTSTGCGHYVAHVRHGDGWVLMNDEKVVGVPGELVQAAVGEAYVYFYRRV
jgi:ubiquitin carboxyl-terminal hydrolase 5/13